MGSLAFPARGPAFEANVSHQNGAPQPSPAPDRGAVLADSETRRLLGQLLHTFERLPE